MLISLPKHGPKLPDDLAPGVETRNNIADQTPPGQDVLQGKFGLEKPECFDKRMTLYDRVLVQ